MPALLLRFFLLRFSYFLPNILVLFQKPILDPTLHVVAMPFMFFLDVTILHTSLIFYDLDTIEKYYQVFYKMFPNLDLSDDFPINLELWILDTVT